MKRSELLAVTPVFDGSKPEKIEAMLECLAARERRFGEGTRVHRMGDVINTAGFVPEGSVRIESVDAWATRACSARRERARGRSTSPSTDSSSPTILELTAARFPPSSRACK